MFGPSLLSASSKCRERHMVSNTWFAAFKRECYGFGYHLDIDLIICLLAMICSSRV
ncbi:unnamed protein product [Musa acuminata subsp. burmannicoides]